MTVRGKARKKTPRTARKAAPPTEAAVRQKPTLDAKDPHWHLKDETLRRGDIVVLDNKVLVFRGDSSNIRLSSFEDLKNTKSITNRERRRILSMTEFWSGISPKYNIVTDINDNHEHIVRPTKLNVVVIAP